nr:MAG TPA: Protein of unknown function (DUF2971) [Caudoviricetes sp.]
MNRVKCSHLSFLARKDEVKCLHSLLIIMGYFLGQHNPSNYFALTMWSHYARNHTGYCIEYEFNKDDMYYSSLHQVRYVNDFLSCHRTALTNCH